MINYLHIRGIARTSVLLLAVTAVGCSSYGKKKNSDGSSGGGEEETTAEVDENGDTKTEVPPGETVVEGDTQDSLDSAKSKVRNYNQFFSTYATLLEIPDNDQDLTNAFLPVKTNLPTLTAATGFLGSHQLALVKFGSAACNRSWDLNTSPESRSRIFGVQDTIVLAEAFDVPGSTEIAKTLISRFWGQDLNGLADTDADVQTIVSLITESVAAMTEFNGALTDAQKIKNTVVGSCTAVITSAGVSFYGQ